MIKAKDIFAFINTIAPFRIAENWDNSGLQVGNLDWEVKKILIGLDVTIPLLEFAKEINADFILTHHPLLMSPEKIIDFSQMPGKAIEISAKFKICIVSAHTNLDKAKEGLNDYFAAKIGIEYSEPLVIEDALDAEVSGNIGIGRVGAIKETDLKLHAVANRVKSKLKLPHIRVTGDMNMPISTIAICTGSGGSLVDEFLNSKADLYITGDIKYHEARKIEEFSKALIDVGHFGSEHMAIELLQSKLHQFVEMTGSDIQIHQYTKERDPFKIY